MEVSYTGYLSEAIMRSRRGLRRTCSMDNCYETLVMGPPRRVSSYTVTVAALVLMTGARG